MPGVNHSQEATALPLALLLQQAMNATQSWEQLLFASGDALEMCKCFAYVMYWDLSKRKHGLLLPEEFQDGENVNGCTIGPISLTCRGNLDSKCLSTHPWANTFQLVSCLRYNDCMHESLH
jgi:hypothetical protein